MSGADEGDHPGRRPSSASAAVTYFSGDVDANSRSPAPPAPERLDRPSSARSVACMLLITSAAGSPLPATSATHRSRRSLASTGDAAARRSSRRRSAGRAGSGPPARSRAPGSAAGNRSAWIRAASVSSLSSFARASSGRLVQRQQPLALVRRLHGALEQPRVLDRRRRLQRQRVQQLQLGGRVRHRHRAAERDDADHALADLERRGDERLDGRVLADRAADRASTSLTISPTPVAATAPMMPRPAGSRSAAAARRRSPRPSRALPSLRRAASSTPSVATIRWRASLQRQLRDRARRRAAPPASRRSCRSG